jgi:hypothetical protein
MMKPSGCGVDKLAGTEKMLAFTAEAMYIS